MKRLIIFVVMVCSQASVADDCVVLLHGLIRSERSMVVLQTALTEEGYQVINVGYPSTEQAIQRLADTYIPAAMKGCQSAERVHFVTHSMGGILVRAYAAKHQIPNLGRVVMIGPPNQGSEVVDKFKGVFAFKWLHGPAGLELGTGSNSTPVTLGKVNFELGVIAGNASVNPVLSLIIPGDDDGKVSVERTKVAGMKAHIVMPVTHPMMMKNKVVIQQVSRFLKTGHFLKLSSTS